MSVLVPFMTIVFVRSTQMRKRREIMKVLVTIEISPMIRRWS